MFETTEITNLKEYFKEISERFETRPARLEIFGELGAQEGARSLPLTGIDVELKGDDAPRVELMFGSPEGDLEHFTHVLTNVRRVMAKNVDGEPAAIDFESEDGTVTLLSFLPVAKTAGRNS